MNINPISKNVNFIQENTVKKQSDTPAPGKEVKQDVQKDRFEISSEAALKVGNGNTPSAVKDLNKIRQNIANKYYNSEEVIQKVAEKIYKEISAQF